MISNVKTRYVSLNQKGVYVVCIHTFSILQYSSYLFNKLLLLLLLLLLFLFLKCVWGVYVLNIPNQKKEDKNAC